MAGKGATPGASDPFLTMMVVAREDPAVRDALLAILAQESFQRRSLLNTWIGELRLEGAPAAFIEALAHLLDDDTAGRARELLERER